MASFVKKTFILAACLVCFIHLNVALAASSLRQSRAVPHTLVPGIAVAKNAPVPQRLEIRTFIRDPTRLNILLIALELIQAIDPSELLSFYRLGAIHGTPLQWDDDDGGVFSYDFGYCHHGDRLFPPWHRPYLSLYETTLLNHATQMVQQFPEGDEKKKHLSSLRTWRIPYWDWAMNPNLADIMGATAASENVVVTKMQSGVLANVTIHNPLYSYRLQIPDDPYAVISQDPTDPMTIETVRNPTVENNVYVSQPVVTNNDMVMGGADLTNTIYQVFSVSTDYNSFSNMEDGANSLESPHGTVHVTVGGDGHMSYVPIAAFDPIFWLHHANVDRLFALWQAMYPNSYVSNQDSDFPNENTALYPFRKTENEYWTSKSSQDTKAFGYTYPELVKSTQQSVIAAVNNLYGPMSAAALNGKRKRDLATINNTNRKEDPDYVCPTTASATYNEYHVRIKISNTAANGSFKVNIFLGKPSSYNKQYTKDPNFVGSFNVFTAASRSKSHKKMVQGTVRLTTALYKLVATGKLKDMKLKTVTAYVKDNLKWVITGKQSGGYDLTGLDISVVQATVKLPKDVYTLSVWGKFSTIYKVV